MPNACWNLTNLLLYFLAVEAFLCLPPVGNLSHYQTSIDLQTGFRFPTNTLTFLDLDTDRTCTASLSDVFRFTFVL
ncbi:uncharacterized protein EDB93DRAFT_49039 [Suillus bovinus]|uniref:uncharacterized protein n=1 Tax=Suillus bovinus TaxID=48563 RepID=UPI001B8871C3|nr:uncharacterized protein EDB93DRAFT_49039 [Suillus bovinus]KAG2160240.1 hypothetical protein EDB93DRAFT_49039 [Suillus bovinus]